MINQYTHSMSSQNWSIKMKMWCYWIPRKPWSSNCPTMFMKIMEEGFMLTLKRTAVFISTTTQNGSITLYYHIHIHGLDKMMTSIPLSY